MVKIENYLSIAPFLVKKQVGVNMAEQLFYVGAYDSGGKNLRVVVARSDGTIVSKNEKNIENIVGKDLPKVVEDRLNRALNAANDNEQKEVDIVAFAGSQAGTIDRENGIIIFSPNVKECKNIKIGDYLADRFSIPFWLENDADAAGYGVLKLDPQAEGMKHLLYIVQGAGVGGGIIINGEIYSGIGAGGEVGHMLIVPNGRRCGCGKKGCWEAYCSGTGIAGMANELPSVEYIKDQLHVEGPLKAEHVFEAAEKNVAAKRIINQVGDYNAIGVSNLINILRPEAVFIGESVAVNNPVILQMLQERVPPLLMPGVKETKILLTKVDNPGLYGAIYWAIDRYKKME